MCVPEFNDPQGGHTKQRTYSKFKEANRSVDTLKRK